MGGGGHGGHGGHGVALEGGGPRGDGGFVVDAAVVVMETAAAGSGRDGRALLRDGGVGGDARGRFHEGLRHGGWLVGWLAALLLGNWVVCFAALLGNQIGGDHFNHLYSLLD